MGYLVSKDGPKRRESFREKLNKLNKLTTMKATTIKVLAYKPMSMMFVVGFSEVVGKC